MASDDKTLRIEAHLQETIEVQSAGDSVRDEAIRQQQSIESPPASSSVADDIRRRIEDADDSPLPDLASAAATSAAGSATQATATGGAAVATAAGGAGGAGGGGVVAGATGGLAAAGAAAAAALGPVGIAAGVAVVGLTAASGAAIALERTLSNLEERLLSGFEPVSPEISLARAEQEVALLMKKIEVEPQVAGEGGLFVNQQTVIYEKLVEISGELVEIITPALLNLMKVVQLLLYIAEKILAVINWVQEKFIEIEVVVTGFLEKIPGPVGAVFSRINNYLEGILGALKEEEAPDPFQQEAVDFLTGQTFRTDRKANPFKSRGFRSAEKRKPPRKP